MADDTPTTVQLLTPQGLKNFIATTDGQGNVTLQSTPRTNGNEVTASNPLPVLDGSVLAQFGTDATGVVQPSGGAGVRGWLSGIYSTLVTSLASLSSIATNTTGSATATRQDAGNTSLSSIVTNTTGVATAAGQTTGNSSLSTIVTNTTGVATAANQSTGNTSLATVATNTGTTATASGTPADAAWGGSGSSTIIAALKAIWTKLGSLTISGSLPAGTNVIGSTTVATLTYSSTVSGSVNTTSGTLVTAGSFTRSLTIATLPSSTTNVWLNPSGATAVVGSGILISAGGGSFTFGNTSAPIPTGNITAITDGSTTQAVALSGG